MVMVKNKIDYKSVYIFDDLAKSLQGGHLYTSIHDFAVAPQAPIPATGTRTLTFSGLPGTVTLSVQSILAGGNVQKIDKHGNVWNIPLTNILVDSANATFNDFEGRFFSDDNILVALAGDYQGGTGGTSGATWGSIAGDLDHQLDLKTALDTIDSRITVLENKDEIYQIWQSISTGSGSVAIPAGASIVLNKYSGGVDAIVTKLDGVPKDEPVLDTNSNIISVTFTSTGGYTLSGDPVSYPVAIIYFITISTVDAATAIDTAYVIDRFDYTTADEILIEGKGPVTEFGNMERMIDFTLSPYTIKGFEFVKNSASISFQAGECLLRTSNSDDAPLVNCYIPATEVPLIDQFTTFIYCDYNNGTAIVTSTLDPLIINFTTQTPVGVCTRIGSYISFADARYGVTNGWAKIIRKTIGTYGFEHMEGTSRYIPLTGAGAVGGRYIYVSGGNNYLVTNIINHGEFNTLLGSTFYEVYGDNHTGVYQRTTAMVALDNFNYVETSTYTLTEMDTDYYSVHLLYISIDGTDPRLYVWRPAGEFATLSEAYAWQLPDYLPMLGQFRPAEAIPYGPSYLIAKIITQKNNDYIIDYQTQKKSSFINVKPLEHDGLAGIDDHDILHVNSTEKAQLHNQNTDTGTDSNTFTIGSTAAVSDMYIYANIGTPALPFVRYNATNSIWELSNNGTDFVSLANIKDNEVFVRKTGSDVFGDGSISNPYLTVSYALSRITANSSVNGYCIRLGPGVYMEPPLQMKSNVDIDGAGNNNTIIYCTDPAGVAISGISNCNLTNIGIMGTTDPGGTLLKYVGSMGREPMGCISILFGATDIVFEADGTTGTGTIFLLQCAYDPHWRSNCFIIKGGISYLPMQVAVASSIIPHNYTAISTPVFTKLSGPGAVFSMATSQTINYNYNGYGIMMSGGATLQNSGGSIVGYGYGLYVDGTAADTVRNIGDFNNVLYDAYISNPDCVGTLIGIADYTKVYVHPDSTFNMSFAGGGDAGQVVLQSIYQGDRYDRLMNLSKLVRESSTMGLVGGGVVSDTSSSLTINVSPGSGFVIDTLDSYIKEISWDTATITFTANQTVYVFASDSGAITTDTVKPQDQYSIPLARVVVNSASITYIAYAPPTAQHRGNENETMLRDTLGAIFDSGCLVSQTSTSARSLTITEGRYYYGSTLITPSEKVTAIFTLYYRDGVGGFNHIDNQNIINNTQYDSGATALSSLTGGYYAKHSLYIVGEGSFQKQFLILAQSQYDTLQGAQGANIPSAPNHLTDEVALIATIIIQEGNNQIVEIRDERPRIGFRPSAVSAITRHNELSDIQGGGAGEYYHLSCAERTIATQVVTTAVDGYMPHTSYNTFLNKPDSFLELSDAPSTSYSTHSEKLVRVDSSATSLEFVALSSLSHNGMGSLQGGSTGEYYHLTSAQHSSLIGSGDSTIHYHSSDRNRSNHTGTQLDTTVAYSSGAITNYMSTAATVHDALDYIFTFPNAGTTPVSSLKNIHQFCNLFSSAGNISGCDLTENPDGSVSVTSGEVLLRTTDANTSQITNYYVGSATLTLTDNATNYIYADYNSSNVTLRVNTDITQIPGTDKVALFIITRVGTDLHTIDARQFAVNFMNRYARMSLGVYGYRHAQGGTVVTEVDTRKISVTSGVFYLITVRIPHGAYNTNTGDMFTYAYRNGTGGWSRSTGQTTISNLYYDNNATALATLGNNKYGVHWLYICLNSPSRLFVVYGQNQYATLSNAQAAGIPATLPPEVGLYSTGQLIAKIIVKKSDTNFSDIQSPFVTHLTSSNPTIHNGLGGLQGGIVDEYYHLSAADYSAVLTKGNILVTSGLTITNGTSRLLGSSDVTISIPASANMTFNEVYVGNNVGINNVFQITKEPTGFINNSIITVTYSSASKTITLTSTSSMTAYWRGAPITAMVSGWVSPAITGATTQPWYLLYDGSNFVWQTNIWSFDQLHIAYVYYTSGGVYGFTQRETHGFMDHSCHAELHYVLGTFLESGGDLTAWTAGSTTAANRRPDISVTNISDEDLRTTLTSKTDKLYTLLVLSGTGTVNFREEQSDFIIVSGAQSYYNLFTSGVWTLASMSNNNYACVWGIAIPTSSDTQSQKYRYVWIQPQSQTATLATAQGLTTNSLNLSTLASISSEFVFFAKIIIRYAAGNWVITQVDKITGNKVTQVNTSVAGNFLSIVATDSSLTGDGTSGNPLSVVSTFTDSTFKIVDNVDNTKTFQFEASSIGSSATVTITIPNRNLTLNNITTSTSTNLSGLLKGSSGLITLAVADTDYLVSTSSGTNLTGVLKSSNNLNDVSGRQVALNNLTLSTGSVTGYVLTVGASGDATWAVAATTYTNEMAQDAVGTILSSTTTINLTYNDSGNTITSSLIIATPSATVNLSVAATGGLTASIIQGGIDHTQIANIGAYAHTSIDTHINNTSNPHNTTSSQVGLGSVINALQLVASANLTDVNNRQIALNNLTLSTAAITGYVLTIGASGDATWVMAGGSGETNTASNIGTTGVGTYVKKVGVNLQFANLAATSTRASVTLDTAINTILIDVVEGNINHDNLSGFVANEHIDWTTATQSISTSGSIRGSSFLVNGTSINTAGALTNVAYLNQAQSFTAKQTFAKDVAMNTNVGFVYTSNVLSAGAVTINWNTSNKQLLTVTANATSITFTAPTNGSSDLRLVIMQDAVGGRTIAFPTSNVKWAAATIPTWTTTANKVDIVSIFFDGTTYYCTAVQNF